MWLTGKNILLIAPKYFDYEKQIKKGLEHFGAHVYLIYENMDKVSPFYKWTYSRLPQRMPALMDSFFQKGIKKLPSNMDFVLVIRGQFLSLPVLDYMKKHFHSGCRYIFYQWDSVRNNPNALEIADFFDLRFTFDPIDAKKYNWEYRPLFYLNHLRSCKNDRGNDILYICSLHSERAQILNQLKSFCAENNFSYKAFLYEKKYIFMKRKYLDHQKEYQAVENKDMTFKSLSLTDIYNLYGVSKVVLDYTHPGQTGFTMRTIESLGNKCKLITNNQEIKNADFYDERNIFVYDNKNFHVPSSFIQSPFYEEEKNAYELYSLDNWLMTLFNKG